MDRTEAPMLARLRKYLTPALRDGMVSGLILLCVSAFIGAYVYHSGATGLKQEVQSYISSVAQSAANFTDGDLHQTITDASQQGGEAYEKLREPYYKLLKANPNITFIYSVIKKDGKIYFILDSEIPDAGAEEDTSDVMEEYEDATDYMKQAIETAKPMVEDEAYTDEWGTFLSAYAPAYNSQGEHIATVGADISLEDYNARLARISNALFLGMVLAVLASAVVGFGVWYVRDAGLKAEQQNREQQEKLAALEAARVQQQERDREENERHRKEALNAMANSLESSVNGVAAEIGGSSETIRAALEGIVRIAGDTKSRSSFVASTSQEAAHMSTQVAAAAEELTASVNEIAQQSQKSRSIAVEATQQAEDARHTIQFLAEKANKVGEIIGVITEIAGQINLLALNASIESARAGEAGKGFAVVASEVKNLAKQVGASTEEISRQISDMQASTASSVEAVQKIMAIIGQVNESAASVAAAVEEQSAVTNEIAGSISRAADGVNKISNEMQAVREGADNVSGATDEALASALGLDRQSSELKAKIEEFLQSVRAA